MMKLNPFNCKWRRVLFLFKTTES